VSLVKPETLPSDGRQASRLSPRTRPLGTRLDRLSWAVQALRFASAERERRDALTRRARVLDQSRSPAPADIIGARRVRTAVMISSRSVLCR
jgi:hypothetical protein